ncbi:MAG TPA: prepilin-type N-terminal cleavage/methylation domain-containing protein [Tepidisphaeraceae bacterium]|nr:prepilin-type N-terminal cleavage/methylation domain-containing protein [Tepidisphaeraceae bacterium]
MKTRNPIRRAFTLIEILAVVTILGLTSAIILPQLSSHGDLDAASAARSITADLLYAQSLSIASGNMTYVVFDSANGKYDLMSAVSPSNVILTHPVLHAPYEVVFGNGALKNVTMSSVSFDGQTTVAFDSLGVPYSYNAGTQTTSALVAGSVVLQSGNATLTVSVQPYSGEIKVQ